MTYAQARAAGTGPNWVKFQIRRGRLIRIYRGVYAVGHVPTEPKARASAALLAVGERSALCDGSAGSLYGVFKHWWEPFHVMTPLDSRRSEPVVHRCQTLVLRDVWLVDGLRVTSPARTALDLAARLETKRLHGAVDHLRLRHGLTRAQLADVLARNPRNPGAGRLREVAGLLTTNPTRSEFERKWPAFARRFGIEGYEMNGQVAGYEVDVLIAGRVIVELDTIATHLLNFESDRRRDAEILARTGIPTLRFTWETFRGEPGVVAAQIAQVVSRS
ncbi:MAG: DUF559 domain-containing protein [Solirubrobacterales bacterium]|nr:DUF559 domain-containing protein [Solirubrobacterales bacterium]